MMMMMTESVYMTVRQARSLLHVSRAKMAELIKAGVLTTEANPLDKRSKLIKRADVQALAAKARPTEEEPPQ